MKQNAAVNAMPALAVIPTCLPQAGWEQAAELLEPRLKRVPRTAVAARRKPESKRNRHSSEGWNPVV